MKKLLNIINVIVCTTLLLSSCTTISVSDNSSINVSQPKSEKKLLMGFDIAFPPMGYKDISTGNIVGFDMDLATEVCKRMDTELIAVPINWDNKQLELENGNVDCLWNGFSKTDEREKSFGLSVAYMDNRQVFIIKKNQNYTSLDDLNNKTLGVQTDSSAYYALFENDNDNFRNHLGKIIKLDNYTTLLTELDNDTVDAVLIDEVVAKFYLNQRPDSYEVIADQNQQILSLASEEYVVGFRKQDVDLKNQVNSMLIEIENDGTMQTISNKWFGEDITSVKA